MRINNHIITIFGGTGDLSFRKLLPAFYNLHAGNKLPESFHIVVVGRQDLTTETYRQRLRPWLKEHSRCPIDDESMELYLSYVSYFKMTFTEDEGYPQLKTYFNSLDENARLLYYFAVSPSFFETITYKLKNHGLTHNAKVIIEKPFGNDLVSAIKINQTLTDILGDDNIYRIDHYIAKEMVQNIYTIRFGNALFKEIWGRKAIKSIQISANETVGVESRGTFYEATGALKDMFPNHLLQILSIVTMEEPKSFDAHHIHHQQEKVLEHLDIKNVQEDVIYGQYTQAINSKSYRDEANVSPDSNVETFVALKLAIDNDRWRDVPIYVRTGKRMHKRSTEVVLEFKEELNQTSNLIIIKIQPDEGVYVRFNIKKPGQKNDTETVFMDFCQSCNYENRLNTPEAYERLLHAAMLEDHTLFASFKQVELSWKLAEKIINGTHDNPLYFYEAFTSGPKESYDLLRNDNNDWIDEEVLGELSS
ncbi:glucose-6-phosphate dehydrogenase [Erysipelothrix urinaevulpis]|uniref:glucose-6-phosphate dehydrogenase n=1 Tax=Erysipelothrix urinaevulpis TaxID=2683717 RepID=UPI0013587A15|nr:glucose-6-phosphate dehydrogenase [Erysipelothrix urinaevulpis]